jgi:hypothetical protein
MSNKKIIYQIKKDNKINNKKAKGGIYRKLTNSF